MEENKPIKKKTTALKLSKEYTDYNSAGSVMRGTNIIQWGKDNQYPYFLNDLMESSPLHGGIIEGKTLFITRGGIEAQFETELADIINDNFESEYSLNEISNLCIKDIEISGLAVMKGKWRADQKSVIWEHVDFEDFRFDIDPETGEERYAIYEDWSDEIKAKKNATWYDGFDPNERTGEFIIYLMQKPKKGKKSKKKVNTSPYPNPPYASGLKAILTDIEIQNYDLSEILNGFSIGTMVTFKGVAPDEEEKATIEREFYAKASGSNSANGVFTIWTDGETEVEVHSLAGNDLADRYTNKKSNVESSILQAHSAPSPLLFGIKTAGQLGGNSELETSYLIMRDNYFQVKQERMMEFLNFYLTEIYNVDFGFKYRQVDLNLTVGQNQSAEVMESKKKVDPELEQLIISELSKAGIERSKATIVSKFEVKETDNLEQREQQILSSFELDLTDSNTKKVLQAINSGAALPEVENLDQIIDDLKENKLLKKNGELTAKGKKAVDNIAVNLEVRYSYEERADAPALKTESREFCTQLLSLNRLYTRAEITQISGLVDRNVWLFRGGWYNNPESKRNEPSCRHTWMQNLIQTT